MAITKVFYDKLNNEDVFKYIVSNDNVYAEFIEFGGCIITYKVKDKNNNFIDICLGYDKLSDYENNSPGFGAIVGRYANRIKDAKFVLDGIEYQLLVNDNNNCLHSGKSYHFRKWDSNSFEDELGSHIEFIIHSPHLDQGFPGALDLKVEYLISVDGSLLITYEYISDRRTPVNLTNHCYFNLNGHNSGDILNHKLWINSNHVTAIDETLIPTGKLLCVCNSALDFRTPTVIKENIVKKFEGYCPFNEYDINYVLDNESNFELVATIIADKTKIGMNVYTDLPGIQVYSGNFLNDLGKDNTMYYKHAGICFETQYYPDSVNQYTFPNSIIEPNKKYITKTKYEFFIEE